MSFAEPHDEERRPAADSDTVRAWRETIGDYIDALVAGTVKDYQPRMARYLLKRAGSAVDDLRARVDALEPAYLATVEEKRLAAARAETDRRMADLALDAGRYFEQSPIRLTGACVSHDKWPGAFRVSVNCERKHGLFGERFRAIWNGRTDYCRSFYVGQGHPRIVAVDRRPGDVHLRRHVEIRNNLLARSYQEGSWSDEPVTLTRAQGWLEEWEDAEAFVNQSGDRRERARASLFDAWRPSVSFLSTGRTDGPLSFRAAVYLVYQVEAGCPLMGACNADEIVIPPGVEMRARRVELHTERIPASGETVFFYLIEADVRKSATYIPRALPLPDAYDRHDEEATEETMAGLGWHTQPIAKRART